MVARRAHGAGRAAGLRSETRPLDEIPAPSATDTARAAAERRVRGRPFQRGNKAAKGRRPALACLVGVTANAKDPRYQKQLRKTHTYRRKRIAELRNMYGYVSDAAAAMVSSSCLALAASRYLYQLAAEEGWMDLIPQAAMLADKARQQELTALDLAQREAAGRPVGEASREPDLKFGVVVVPAAEVEKKVADAEERRAKQHVVVPINKKAAGGSFR